ncbi:MAG: hypothetical protein ACN4E2_05585 [Nitrospinota bacterium]
MKSKKIRLKSADPNIRADLVAKYKQEIQEKNYKAKLDEMAIKIAKNINKM